MLQIIHTLFEKIFFCVVVIITINCSGAGVAPKVAQNVNSAEHAETSRATVAIGKPTSSTDDKESAPSTAVPPPVAAVRILVTLEMSSSS